MGSWGIPTSREKVYQRPTARSVHVLVRLGGDRSASMWCSVHVRMRARGRSPGRRAGARTGGRRGGREVSKCNRLITPFIIVDVMNQSWKAHIIFNGIILPLLYSLVLSAQTAEPRAPVVELRIRPSDLVNEVPDTISFVFVNAGDREVRIPPVSPCLGHHSGTLALRLEFSPAGPPGAGKGGGCAGWLDHVPGILEEVKSWKRLNPGESFTVSYKRVELSVFEQAPGLYEFWGEYRPPKLTAEEIELLQSAGIDFASKSLRSTPLRFNRPN